MDTGLENPEPAWTSWSVGVTAAAEPPSSSSATTAARAAALGRQKDTPQLIFLPRRKDRKDLVPGPQGGRIVGDLELTVPFHRDQPRPVRQVEPLDRTAGAVGVRRDQHLDDLDVFLRELEQVDQPVLGNL